jgi:methylenetetrahydrofolate reductase (NADPH)
MHVVREEGLDRKAFILVGVGPLRSWKVARWMSEHVPGVVIPEPVLDHLSRTPGPFQREEGKRLCVDLIRQIREIPGVSGIHVMAYRQESLVAEIVEEAGLIPRQTQVRPPEPAAA